MRRASEDIDIARKYPSTEESWEVRNGLTRGIKYHVIKEFVDADGDTHPVGEAWFLVCAMFSKFDGEIQFGVDQADGTDWLIPLGWDKGRQAAIVEDISRYISPI